MILCDIMKFCNILIIKFILIINNYRRKIGCYKTYIVYMILESG